MSLKKALYINDTLKVMKSFKLQSTDIAVNTGFVKQVKLDEANKRSKNTVIISEDQDYFD